MSYSVVLATSLLVPQCRNARALILLAVASQNPDMEITMPIIAEVEKRVGGVNLLAEGLLQSALLDLKGGALPAWVYPHVCNASNLFSVSRAYI